MAPHGKTLFDRLLIPLIILLVALSAFGLGRLSALSGQESGITITSPQE